MHKPRLWPALILPLALFLIVSIKNIQAEQQLQQHLMQVKNTFHNYIL